MAKNGTPDEQPLGEMAIMLILIAQDALQTGRAIRRDLLEIMRKRMGITDEEMRRALIHIGEAHIRLLREEYGDVHGV